MGKNLIILIFALLILGSSAIADTLPRGSEIQSIAGNCSVGPFGQTESAGEYDEICNQLSRAEICFAYIKGHMKPDGEVEGAHDQARATFCSRILLHQLTTQGQ